PFARRIRVCVLGLAYNNPDRLVWEAAAAVPFTAFCAAALIPEQTAAKASGYRVMGLPGVAPHGYTDFSYGLPLATERTATASLRAPTEIFERRDRNPRDAGSGRVWPAALSRAALDPYYARAEAGLRVNRPTWDQVSKSGGLWAANLNAAGHTCDRVPLAIS